MPKLRVELIPKSAHYQNVRNAVGSQLWNILRKDCYAKANHRCEICGGKGRDHPVEAHEVWEWNEKARVQRLVRLIALCPACHEVKHYGLAELRGRAQFAFLHLLKVNGWTKAEGRKHLRAVFKVWRRRSQVKWTLDAGPLAEQYPEVKKALKKKAK